MAKGNNEQIYNTELVSIPRENIEISNLVYVFRGKQVMIDSDLAMLYQIETKNLNKAVSRNSERFPEDFRFKLNKEEYECLRFQFGTSKEDQSGRGGRRFYPYVYTEQGISMLASVIRSEVAVRVSINIMRAFVEMRRFISSNALLFEKVSNIELKQLEYQKETDEKLNIIFNYIDDHSESRQKIFFDGQIYDAFSFITSIVQKAEKDIILIDGYVDVNTLNILAKKQKNVKVLIYTYPGSNISGKDIDCFNTQYPKLMVKKTQIFHDRFVILDHKIAYHIGASIKDAGKKCFGITCMEDPQIIEELINRTKKII